MAENPVLHERLIARQSDAELDRKAAKARTKAIWTQEEIDAIKRRASRMVDWFRDSEDDHLLTKRREG